MPKLIIDGQEIEVPKGTRIIEAAKKLDITIPYYCYHPGLSVAGNCRMCLVEIEKMPKLQISCHMECQDGMVVRTNTEKIIKTRQHVLEFLLVNHPLDCPVCDQAGECWLQDYYMKHGLHESRVAENKIKKKKAVSVGPTVMLDSERCILCSRCVRFTDEVSKTGEFGIINRGDHSEISIFPGKELNNPYSGNVVDICPVGALTDKDFRFKVRVWYLKSKESICNGCSRGCNIEVQYRTDRLHHAQGERVMRLKPRFNETVNKWWICDEGRYGYKFHDHNRITAPVLRHAGSVKETGWEEALKDAASKIQSASGKIGVFLSPQMSNEELFLAKKIFRDYLRLSAVHLLSPLADGFEDDLLIRADKNPNSKGAEWLGFPYHPQGAAETLKQCGRGELKGLIVFGQDLLSLASQDFGDHGLARLEWSLFVGTNHNLMAAMSSHVLPQSTYFENEGTFTNFQGRVQRFSKVFEPLGESRPAWKILMDLARFLGFPIPYDREEDIFDALALELEQFRGLNYEALGGQGSDIRVFGAPMIPLLQKGAPTL